MSSVLVVEDNNTIRMMYVAGLEGLGLQVVEARNLDQARLVLTGPNPPRVVLLDLRLPGEPGQNLIPFIRKDLGLKDVRIIVASAVEHARDDVLALGADEFVNKPVDFVHLFSLIQQAIR